MRRALLWLWIRSLRNRLVLGLRRLRSPRRLIATLIGIGYFVWIVFGNAAFMGSRARPEPGPGAEAGRAAAPELIAPLLPLVALLVLVIPWVSGSYRTFRAGKAEVTWLLPAPLTRRVLIESMILREQGGLLASSAITACILSWSAGSGLVETFAGMWLLLTAMSLHSLLAAGLRLRIRRRLGGLAAWAIPAGAACALLAGLLLAVLLDRTAIETALESLGQGPDGAAFQDGLAVLLATPALLVAALPGRILLAPVLGLGPAGPAAAASAAFLLLHLPLVTRCLSPVLPEALRAAAEARESRERELGGRRRVRRRRRVSPWKLSARGRPEIAFLWKGLAARGWLGRPRNLAFLLAFAAAGPLVLRWFLPDEIYPLLGSTLATFLLMGAGFLVLAGGRRMGAGFQRNLPHMDLLRSLPVRGWSVLLGDSLASATVLSAISMAMVVSGILLLLGGPAPLAPSWLATIGIGAALVLPSFFLVTTLAITGLILLWPEWFATAEPTYRGIEGMGRGILFLLVRLVLLVLVVGPAAVVATVVLLPATMIIGAWSAAAAGAAAALLLLLEATGLLWLLERVWNAFDPLADTGGVG